MTREWWAARARYWFTPITGVIIGAPLPGFACASLLRHSPQWWSLLPAALAVVVIGVIGHVHARAAERRLEERYRIALARYEAVVDEGQFGYWPMTSGKSAVTSAMLVDAIRAGAHVTPIEAARARRDPAVAQAHRLESELARHWLAHVRQVNPDAARHWAGGDDA